MMTHGLIEGQPGARALFAQDPGFVGQLFQRCLPAFRQRMLWRAEHHQLILYPRLHLDVRVAAIALDQAQVDFVVRHLLHDVRGVLDVKLDLAFRVALHVAADQQGRQVIADGQRRAYRQRAEAGFTVEQVFDFLGLIEQRSCLPVALRLRRLPARSNNWQLD